LETIDISCVSLSVSYELIELTIDLILEIYKLRFSDTIFANFFPYYFSDVFFINLC